MIEYHYSSSNISSFVIVIYFSILIQRYDASDELVCGLFQRRSMSYDVTAKQKVLVFFYYIYLTLSNRQKKFSAIRYAKSLF